MIKLACGIVGAIAMAACSNGDLALNANTSLAMDSVAHGGSDIYAVKFTDTLQVLLGSPLTPPSTSSTNTPPVKCEENIREAHTAAGAPAAEVIVTCPAPK